MQPFIPEKPPYLKDTSLSSDRHTQKKGVNQSKEYYDLLHDVQGGGGSFRDLYLSPTTSTPSISNKPKRFSFVSKDELAQINDDMNKIFAKKNLSADQVKVLQDLMHQKSQEPASCIHFVRKSDLEDVDINMQEILSEKQLTPVQIQEVRAMMRRKSQKQLGDSCSRLTNHTNGDTEILLKVESYGGPDGKCYSHLCTNSMKVSTSD